MTVAPTRDSSPRSTGGSLGAGAVVEALASSLSALFRSRAASWASCSRRARASGRLKSTSWVNTEGSAGQSKSTSRRLARVMAT